MTIDEQRENLRLDIEELDDEIRALEIEILDLELEVENDYIPEQQYRDWM